MEDGRCNTISDQWQNKQTYRCFLCSSKQGKPSLCSLVFSSASFTIQSLPRTYSEPELECIWWQQNRRKYSMLLLDLCNLLSWKNLFGLQQSLSIFIGLLLNPQFIFLKCKKVNKYIYSSYKNAYWCSFNWDITLFNWDITLCLVSFHFEFEIG